MAGFQLSINGRFWVSTEGGQYMYCYHTGVTGGQYCIRESTTGNAQVTLSMNSVCNGWAGFSNHMYKNPSEQFFTGIPQNMPRFTSLWSYCTEAEQCADQGADYYWDGGQCVYTPGSPIIVSTRKDGKYKLTSVADGVWFDIDGDGVPEQVAWTQPESDVSFLAIDLDGDGKISSGRELFGNHTMPGASNGFIALLQMTMANGGTSPASVSGDDPIFARLLLWTDNNHNGISEQWELRRANDVLSAVGLGYAVTDVKDNKGNVFRYRGWAHLRTAPGRNRPQSRDEDVERTIEIWDVYLALQ